MVMQLSTQSACLGLAMLMSLILAQVLTQFSQLRFGISPSVAADSGTERNSILLSAEWIRALVWTCFSMVATLVFRWSFFAMEIAGDRPLLPQLLILAPHVACLLLLWASADWNRSNMTSAGWFIQHARQQIGPRFQMYLVPVMLPVLAVYSVRELLEYSPVLRDLPGTSQTVLLSFLAMSFLLITYPFMLSRLWTSRALSTSHPEEARHLEETADQLRLRISRVEMWDTQYRIANAAVVGWIPKIRKVLLSDVLVRILTPTELRSVFLHEAGHIKSSHSLWRVMTVLYPLVLFLIAFSISQRWNLPAIQTVLILATLGLFAISTAILCWVSKQLELEADRFVWHQQREQPDRPMSIESDPLVSALFKTAQVTNTSIHQASLFHPTTAVRIASLADLYDQPGLFVQRQKKLQRAKQAMVTFLLLLLGILVMTMLV